MSACKTCDARIIWATTEAGKAMPLDEQASLIGTWVIVNGKTWKATDEDRRLHRLMYVPHWATCNVPGQHRRRT